MAVFGLVALYDEAARPPPHKIAWDETQLAFWFRYSFVVHNAAEVTPKEQPAVYPSRPTTRSTSDHTFRGRFSRLIIYR